MERGADDQLGSSFDGPQGTKMMTKFLYMVVSPRDEFWPCVFCPAVSSDTVETTLVNF